MRELDIDREIAQRGIPVSAQNTYRRALAGSRPAAVKALCLECQGWEDGARQAVRDCPSVGCPLHAVRPFQKKAGKLIDIDIDTERDHDDFDGNDNPQGFDPIASVKDKIMDHLNRHGASQRAYILFSTGIPESLWNEAIRSLLAEGKVEKEGEKRNTRYLLKEGA